MLEQLNYQFPEGTQQRISNGGLLPEGHELGKGTPLFLGWSRKKNHRFFKYSR